MSRLNQQIQFILEIDKLKSVLRQTMLLTGERRENTAEHSWHIAMIAVTLAEYSNQPIDVAHVVKMLLIHDIVEIDAGDTFGYDVVGYEDKAAREQAAAARIFGLLPPDQRDEYQAIWQEFEARQTAEAKFANVADRLMPIMHNFHTEGNAWQRHGITKSQVIQRIKPMADGSEALWQFTETLINEAVEKGYLAADNHEPNQGVIS